jgi:hypothetical protein
MFPEPVGNPRIIYTSRFDATLEGVLDALASLYALVLQEYQKNSNKPPSTSPPSMTVMTTREL